MPAIGDEVGRGLTLWITARTPNALQPELETLARHSLPAAVDDPVGGQETKPDTYQAAGGVLVARLRTMIGHRQR